MEGVDKKNEILADNKPVLDSKAKLKENPFLFYGLPALAFFSILLSLFFVVIPTVSFYFDSSYQNEILDKNKVVAERSIANLKTGYSNFADITRYNDSLTKFVPEEAKLGDILNTIQTKAKDFNLESKVADSRGTSRTSIDNLAGDGKLFDSISSGEISFQPKSLGNKADAKLISIEVNIKGDQKSFLSFVKEMEGLKPIINLSFLEYSENRNGSAVSVSALMRFESYSLKIRGDNAISLKKLNADSPELVRSMAEESFEVRREVVEGFGS